MFLEISEILAKFKPVLLKLQDHTSSRLSQQFVTAITSTTSEERTRDFLRIISKFVTSLKYISK